MKKALYIIPIIFLILITAVCGYYFTAYNRTDKFIITLKCRDFKWVVSAVKGV